MSDPPSRETEAIAAEELARIRRRAAAEAAVDAAKAMNDTSHGDIGLYSRSVLIETVGKLMTQRDAAEELMVQLEADTVALRNDLKKAEARAEAKATEAAAQKNLNETAVRAARHMMGQIRQQAGDLAVSKLFASLDQDARLFAQVAEDEKALVPGIIGAVLSSIFGKKKAN